MSAPAQAARRPADPRDVLLGALSEDIERGWQGTFVEGEGFRFEDRKSVV